MHLLIPSEHANPRAKLHFAIAARERLRRHNNAHVATLPQAEAIAWHRSWFRPRNAAITRAILDLRPVVYSRAQMTVEPPAPLPWIPEKERIRSLPPQAAELTAIDLTKAFEGEARTAELPDPLEDYTTYSIVPDPLVYTSVAANKLTITNLPANVDEYVYKDMGVDHFGATFEHLVHVKRTASTGTADAGLWAVSNVLDDGRGWYDAYGQALGLRRYSNTYYLANHETRDFDGGTAGATGFWRYLVIERTSETAIECRIWHTAPEPGGVLVDTLVVAIDSGRRYRYVFGVNSWNDGNAGALYSGESANLDLQEAAAFVPFVHLHQLDGGMSTMSGGMAQE